MGFNPFKAITRIVAPVINNPVKAITSAVNQVIQQPARTGLAVLSGGTSELARIAPVIGKPFKEATMVGDAVFSALQAGYTGGLTSIGRQALQSEFGPSGGGVPMALNIGGILSQVGGIFGGGQNPIFSTVGQVASLASQFFPPQQMSQVVQTAVAPMQVMSMVPAIRGMATRLTREIFDAGGKVLGRLGISYSASPGAFASTLKRALSSIASLARRTPSGTMVSILIGLGLTALEANMLTAWHAQRKKGRRMNSANPRALRRAARRIKSFHRMCSTIDLLKSRSRRVGASSRCGSCKKSPCRC